MKNRLILTLLTGCILSADALAVGLSNTNSGIYVAVMARRASEPGVIVYGDPIRFDDGLFWCPFCTAGSAMLSYPSPSYGVKVKMIGADGVEVPKTRLGKTFGSKWDRLHSYKDDHLRPVEAQGHYDARGGGYGGPFLPSPVDLFEMKKPGTYTLEMEIQLFRYTASLDLGAWKTNLVHLSAIRLNVEKPPDAKK